MENVNFTYEVSKITNKHLKLDLVSNDYSAEVLTDKILTKANILTFIGADEFQSVKAEVLNVINTSRPHQMYLHIEGTYNNNGFETFKVYLK